MAVSTSANRGHRDSCHANGTGRPRDRARDALPWEWTERPGGRSLARSAPSGDGAAAGYRQAARGQRRRSITSARPAYWMRRDLGLARPAGPEGLHLCDCRRESFSGSSRAAGLAVAVRSSPAILERGPAGGWPCRSAWRQRTERVPRDYQPEGEDVLVPPEVVLLVNFLVGAVLLVVATSGLLGRWLSRHSVALVALAALPLLTAVLLTVSTPRRRQSPRRQTRPLGCVPLSRSGRWLDVRARVRNPHGRMRCCSVLRRSARERWSVAHVLLPGLDGCWVS